MTLRRLPLYCPWLCLILALRLGRVPTILSCPGLSCLVLKRYLLARAKCSQWVLFKQIIFLKGRSEGNVRSEDKIVTFCLIGLREGTNKSCKAKLCQQASQRMKKVAYRYGYCTNGQCQDKQGHQTKTLHECRATPCFISHLNVEFYSGILFYLPLWLWFYLTKKGQGSIKLGKISKFNILLQNVLTNLQNMRI